MQKPLDVAKTILHIIMSKSAHPMPRARCFTAVESGLVSAHMGPRFDHLALVRRDALPAAMTCSGDLRSDNLQASEAADLDSALTTQLSPICPSNAVTH